MELHTDPAAIATPMAMRDFFSGCSLVRRLMTHAERVVAQTRWRRRVKGPIETALARPENDPIPVTIRAAAEEAKVRLNHFGVVSRRVCLDRFVSPANPLGSQAQRVKRGRWGSLVVSVV